MADDGRARLQDYARRFSHVDAGAPGRQIRTPFTGADPRPIDDRRDAESPTASYYGLAELYATSPPAWGGASTGLTAEPLPRRHPELPHEPSSSLWTESAHVGSWSSIWDTSAVSTASESAGLGDDAEVAWYSSALAGAVAAVGTVWALIKRYPISACLWTAVVVVWVLPH